MTLEKITELREVAENLKVAQPTTNMIEHIANLTEAEAKMLLQFAMQDLRNAIYSPSLSNDAAHLGWLTQKIESLAKENTQP
jgi:N-acetylmuramic acid 6-phosphate (MurNAc-6-P) etherase